MRLERPHDDVAQAVLGTWILDGAQQQEAATVTAHGVLTRRERDVLAVAVAARPYGKSDQLQAIEIAASEVDLGVCELAGGLVTVVA